MFQHNRLKAILRFASLALAKPKRSPSPLALLTLTHALALPLPLTPRPHIQTMGSSAHMERAQPTQVNESGVSVTLRHQFSYSNPQSSGPLQHSRRCRIGQERVAAA